MRNLMTALSSPWVLLFLLVLAPGCQEPTQTVAGGQLQDTNSGFPVDVVDTADGSKTDAAVNDTAVPKDALDAGDAAGSDSGALEDSDTAEDSAGTDVSPGDSAEPDGAGPDSGDADGGGTADAGSCAEGEKLCATAFAYTGAGDEGVVEVRGSWNGWKAAAPMALDAGVWKATIKLPQGQDILYKFRVVSSSGKEQWLADPGNPQSVDDGYGGKNSILSALSCPVDGICPLPTTLCGAPAKVGAFDWRDGVMYFVFVDRFLNGDTGNDKKNPNSGVPDISNWMGGDWKGVTQKIEAGWFKDLGVNVLWLTVPMDNTEAAEYGDDGKLYTAFHGYWPRDINSPNAHFGSMADLKTLVDTAHAQGIQVVLDYAMNHLHKDAQLFKDHPDWFYALNGGGGDCICGSGPCPWDGPSGIWCWFRDYLPDFNFNNAAARKASLDNVMWWMEQSGADGLRLDAIKHIDGPWLTELRQRLNAELEPKRGQHIWLVGETYTGDQNLIKSFIDPCTKLDGQFDFPWRAVLDEVVLLRKGKMGDLESFMNKNDTFYGPDAVMSPFAGNHDLPRLIHLATDPPLFQSVWDAGKGSAWNNPPEVVQDPKAYERVALAMAVLMTNRGVPLIYYGDEIGMPGAGDPDNRRMMAWTGWNDPQKQLLAQMKKLGQLRKELPVLRRGVRTTEWIGQDAWVYKMSDASGSVYVAINRGDAPVSVGGLPAGSLKDSVSGESVSGPEVSVPARGFRIFPVTP